jgi:hypothetical protein
MRFDRAEKTGGVISPAASPCHQRDDVERDGYTPLVAVRDLDFQPFGRESACPLEVAARELELSEGG